MKTIYINKDGWVRSPYFPDGTDEIEVSDLLYEALSTCKVGYNWKYDFNAERFTMALLTTNDNLKELRQVACFSIIDNRSPMWYNRLTAEQKQELDEWYQAWLDVTETKVIPVKPEWL